MLKEQQETEDKKVDNSHWEIEAKYCEILKNELLKKKSKNQFNFWIYFLTWLVVNIAIAIKLDDLNSLKYVNDLKNIQGTIGILLFFVIFSFIMWIICAIKWADADGGLNILNKIVMNNYENDEKKKNK